MNTTQQAESLRLAEQYDYGDPAAHSNTCKVAVCTELLRQHAENETLRAGYAAARLEVESLKAQLVERAKEHADELTVAYMCGVSGPPIGQPQTMPDLSNLTERGAKAWAGVDAQGLRDGGASPSANAGEPSAHIKEPYTLAEIKAKIASNDYSAEMLLQHAMLLLDSVQEDAALWHWLAEYLVGTRTDLDDEIVASETVNDLRKLVEAAIKQGARWQSAVRALTLHI